MKSLKVLAIATAICASGCAGASQAIPTAAVAPALANADACATISTSVDFNGTPIERGSWIWFTSAFTTPHADGPFRLEMRRSLITFTVGHAHYTIEGPNSLLNLTSGDTVKLGYPGVRDFWNLVAPYDASGHRFLNAMAYHAQKRLPGNIVNVTWSAQFYGKDAPAIKWRWGAAVYKHFTNYYAKLEAKPLENKDYPPYNTDRAGTPEAYKQFLIGGGTGSGGTEYTGTMSSPVTVTPCR